MSRLGINDVVAILRGLQNVANATVRLQESQIKQVWNNSSLKEMAEDLRHTGGKSLMNSINSDKTQNDLSKQFTELLERVSMVGEGVKAYVKYSGGVIPQTEPQQFATDVEINELNLYSAVYQPKFDSDIHSVHSDVRNSGPPENPVGTDPQANVKPEIPKTREVPPASGKEPPANLKSDIPKASDAYPESGKESLANLKPEIPKLSDVHPAAGNESQASLKPEIPKASDVHPATSNESQANLKPEIAKADDAHPAAGNESQVSLKPEIPKASDVHPAANNESQANLKPEIAKAGDVHPVAGTESPVNLKPEIPKVIDAHTAPGKAVRIDDVGIMDKTVPPEQVTTSKSSDREVSAAKTNTSAPVVPPPTSPYVAGKSAGPVKPGQPYVKTRQTLSSASKQRAVPSSRIGRLISFGGLAAGLGMGAVAELTRRTLGLKDQQAVGSADNTLLTPANAERIVNTLCKVRGAALKIGQILSIQDENVISPALQKAFERVRQSADFMPSWQVERVLQSELGSNWKEKVKSFEEKPFAAASIGQVHLAVLPNGQEVAMKIQYPGVAQGIQSDIDNLIGVLKVWNIFPEGFFIDNIVEVAKRELAWEVDYKREAQCTKKFKELLKPYPDYIVPEVVDELSSQQVFSTMLIDGMSVDKCAELDLETRERICFLIMQLCIKELFEFQYMQTDPNWSNFFYNPETRKMALLDFGASREYSKDFMDKYIQVIRGAADNDRKKVLDLSRELGFLTGYESKIMEEAHVDAVMILGEVFRSRTPFDFGAQNTTKQIQQLVPTMIKHRLCPPPEEIYSLHRKLSGVFLLCSKLHVKMLCRPMFEEAYERYMSVNS